MKIAVFNSLGLENDQIERLKDLGKLTFVNKDTFSFSDFKGIDIICAEEPISRIVYELEDKFISFPFVGVNWLDLKRLSKKNVVIANAPGCNKEAVTEWVIAMMLILSRKLDKYINIKNISKNDFLEPIRGITGKNITILGAGNIGSKVAEVCKVFEMNITLFKKGDSLIKSINNADFIINTLPRNESTVNLFDKNIFKKIKNRPYFISITDLQIFNLNALIEALDSGNISAAAIDPAGIPIFDPNQDDYKKLLNHNNLIVTPHIAFHTNRTLRLANDIMIDNVEAWIKRKPQNLVN